MPELEPVALELGDLAQRGRHLGPLTTYGVGGPAAVFVELGTIEDLERVRVALNGSTVPTLVIGRGSNLLVSDAGFEGVALHLGASFADVTWPAGNEARDEVVTAGAATALPVLARQAADRGWSGLSWAVGVPGSVGGAVRMNAGGHGSDMAAVVRRYTWVDLCDPTSGGTDDVTALHYGYRTSSIGPSHLVLSAGLQVVPGAVETEKAALAEIVRWRREHQPGGSNAGSVFTNPEGDSAGRLIEEAGLKGFRLGTAHVSEKHANFIQAAEDGRADDVRALIEEVRSLVLARCGVSLTTEVRLLGFDGWETGRVTAMGNGQ